MKKQNVVDLVVDFLAGGQPDDMIGQYHPAIIKKYLENAFNQVVYQVWLNCKRFSDYSQLDAWTYSYDDRILISPVIAGDRVSGYVRLPYPPMQLPDNMGIRQVSIHRNENIVFAYLDNNAVAIFNELEVSSIDATPTFRLEMNNSGVGSDSHILRLAKIPLSVYNTYSALDWGVLGIAVKMVVPLDQIGDYDDIAMPAGQEDNLVKQTVEFLRNKPPQDTAPDQVANRPNQL
jgi:hypothetical protein